MAQTTARKVRKEYTVKGNSLFGVTLFTLIALSLFSVTHIVKNTSAFFLAPTHPVRADHIDHQEVFSRTAYSAFVTLRLKEGSDIYRNDLVTTLNDIHEAIERIDLVDHIAFDRLTTNYGLDLQSSNKQQMVDSYNSLLSEHSSPLLETVFGQYIFPIKSIKSLINTDNIYDHDDELIVESNYVNQEDWNSVIRTQISSNELLKGGLFSSDEGGVNLQIEFSIDNEDTALNLALMNKIKQSIEAEVTQNSVIKSVHYAGGPVLDNALSKVMEKDNAKYFPLVIAFVLITITLFYRSILCAAYGLCIALLSILFTMALMPVLGITLNIVTTILPVFIITIAVTDAIHVMSDVTSQTSSVGSVSHRQQTALKVRSSIRKLFRPMLLTSLTTGLGFLSLTLTEIGNIRGFGFMVSISVIIAFILSVTVLPRLMVIWPVSASNNSNSLSRLNRGKARFVAFVTHNNWPSLACLFVVGGLAAFGLPRLEVDQASIAAFDKDSQLRMDNDVFVRSGSGSVVLNLWFTGEREGAVLTPDVLKIIQSVQEAAKEHGIYVDGYSIVDFLDRLHRVLEGTEAEPLDLNDTARIRQYLFLLEGGAERDLDTVVTVGDYRQTRIALSLAQDNSAAIAKLMQAIDQSLDGKLPNGISYSYTGYGAIVEATADAVFYSQLNSLGSSLAAILLVFLVVYRSLTTAIVGVIPLLATLISMFGLMGAFGFSIDIGSSLVAGIAFGIGIDYSIHLIEALRRSAYSHRRADIIKSALSQVTLPIMVSAIVLSSGFSLLLLSGFKSLASLGLLVMVSMLVSAIFALAIMPMVFKLLPSPMFLALLTSDQVNASMSKASYPIDSDVIVIEGLNEPSRDVESNVLVDEART